MVETDTADSTFVVTDLQPFTVNMALTLTLTLTLSGFSIVLCQDCHPQHHTTICKLYSPTCHPFVPGLLFQSDCSEQDWSLKPESAFISHDDSKVLLLMRRRVRRRRTRMILVVNMMTLRYFWWWWCGQWWRWGGGFSQMTNVQLVTMTVFMAIWAL